jgi:hypothetical protein
MEGAVMAALSNLNPAAAASSTDVITGGTLNLTKTSTYIAAISAILVGSEDAFKSAFPDSLHPTAGVKAAVLIAIIGAWALIVVSDILSRGYAHGRATSVLTAPAGLSATTTDGEDVAGWTVAAIRPAADGEPSFLIVKAGQAPKWVAGSKLKFG